MMATKNGAPRRVVTAPTGRAEPLPSPREQVSANSSSRLPLSTEAGVVYR